MRPRALLIALCTVVLGLASSRLAEAAGDDVAAITARCPTAAELTAIDADVQLIFTADPTSGTTVCTVGSRNLTFLQAQAYRSLIIMRRLTFNAPLPWTSESLYNWMIHSIRAIKFRSDIQFSFCCDPADTVNIQTGVAIADPTLPPHPVWLISFIELLVHETRHNNGYPHTCGTNDATLTELGGWGAQYYTAIWIADRSDPAFVTAEVREDARRSADALLSTFCQLPVMSLDRTALYFSAVSNGTAFVTRTSAQTVRLTQAGAGAVTWTATSTVPWLTVSPASGSGSATLTISTQFAAGLAESQSGAIALTFTGARAAGPVSVTLRTVSVGSTVEPVGSFDTPLEGTTGVTGSIAVTGWAIDDVEVTGVRILRDPVAGEPAGTLVFLGNAVLVEGARPDVQASFPTTPRSSRAGWGYLLLTNFLPNLGNGTFRLHAIADDADGRSTVLGTRTVTCTNNAATTPFGAIDTPAQGETVSGVINNFGWVLSPGARRADPPNGGAVTVFIDGQAVGSPTGWVSRADLVALFPAAQFSGVSNALGVFTYNTAALSNGVHTISWLVTDNQGGAAGVGSRYFTVSNGSALTLPGTAVGHRFSGAGTAEAVPYTRIASSMLGRRGFDPATPYRAYEPDIDGRITIHAEELDRIEVLLEGIEHGTLPIGSRIDPATRIFTWNPGVGFVGTYDFVLGGRDVRVVLNPKGSNRVGPQVVIDLPAKAGHQRALDVTDGFIVAGWAADLASPRDAGVDVVHLWAYPAAGGDPIFVGAAATGGTRPDVAAVYGDRFAKSGYGIRVNGLAPGTYDIAVFAYSTVTGGFVPAKTVRVTVR